MSLIRDFSLLAVAMRILGVGLILNVMRIQLGTFRTKSNVQPLKRLLFSLVIVLFLSNIIPIIANWFRIQYAEATALVIAAASVSNAATFLFAVIVLHLIYTFKVKE